jgi:hypothetical protein
VRCVSRASQSLSVVDRPAICREAGRPRWTPTADAPVELGEFLAGAVEGDLQAVDFAEPVVSAGFGDPGDEVVSDLDETRALGGVGSEWWASEAGVFVDAWVA